MSGHTLFSAANKTDIAIISSTQRVLSDIKSSAVAVSVIECASVNAVTIHAVCLMMCCLDPMACHVFLSRVKTQVSNSAIKNKI